MITIFYVYLATVLVAMILGLIGNKTLGAQYETHIVATLIPLLNVLISVMLIIFLSFEFIPRMTKWYYKS